MFLTIEKRTSPSPTAFFLNPIISIILALISCGVVLFIAGIDPLKAYNDMFRGAFGSAYSFSETLVKATPLILCALGVSLAFKVQLWNIGAEGQLYMGATAAAFVALKMGDQSPFIALSLMILAGFLMGGLWGLIPGILKAFAGVNEVIATLMLNYVAIYFVDYLVYGPWKDPAGYGFPMTAQFSRSCWLPCIGNTRVHMGLLFGIIAAIILAFILFKTRWGYEIRVTGANPDAARYGGMNSALNIILLMFFSGALAGLAGMAEVSGIQHRLQHGFSPGYGFTAIIVAWLSKLHPVAIIGIAILFGGLLVGGDQLQISMGLPVSFSYIIQGTILFFILGGETLTNYAIRFKSVQASPKPEKIGEDE